MIRRSKTARLSIFGDSLRLREARGYIDIPLESVAEIDLDMWPNIGMVAFWLLVPGLFVIWFPANLNIRIGSRWLHFRIVPRKNRNALVDELLGHNIRLRGVGSWVES